MKMSLKTAALAALFASLCAITAQARDTAHVLPVKSALETSEAKAKLDGDIRFYFGNQPHSAVEARLTKGVVSNKRTNAANKSAAEACNHVILSALISLQERARKEGGNAVINIESYFKKKTFRSNDQFECYVGSIMAAVTLKGDVVKLKR
ncbi:MAG: excinuclease ATPase subunit [Betaproteobacteria bacterium]|nr:excinuclease ATPase subunit [Betaproteobacteria bacterium]